MIYAFRLVWNVEGVYPELLGVFEGADADANNVVYSIDGVMHNAPADCVIVRSCSFMVGNGGGDNVPS